MFKSTIIKTINNRLDLVLQIKFMHTSNCFVLRVSKYPCFTPIFFSVQESENLQNVFSLNKRDEY